MKPLIYKEFIDNIIKERGRHGCGDKYKETHHIVPRCMGGGNNEDNLVDLFANEHYIAHKLLAEENPDNYKIVYAWTCMAFTKNDVIYECEITPEEYEEAKIALSIKMTGDGNPFYGKHHTEETRKKLSQARIGTTHTDESKNKMSKSRIGNKNHFYGKQHTQESKNKMSVSSSGINNGRSKSVYCNELDKAFGSTREAERETGVCYRSIVDCANGKQKHAGKHPVTGEQLTWVYLDNKKIKNDIS